ncbi:MAG: phosphodiester glycosidase family protein [Butyricicoccus sp.]
MAEQHHEEQNSWEQEDTRVFQLPEKPMSVVYDESIARRPGFSEHSARGIAGAGFCTRERIKRRRRQSAKRTVGVLAALVIFCTSMYYFLVYSSIPFIEKWRTIYIETAMGTMTHQWLATAFLPQDVIDSVMNSRTQVQEDMKGLSSSWTKVEQEETIDYTQAIRPWSELESEFGTYYSEIDQSTMEAYLSAHPEAIEEDGYLFIDEADYGDEDTGIRTTRGDAVCVVDTRNGIVIITLQDDSYYGKLALVKCAGQVGVAASEYLGSSGEFLETIVQDNNAILGINASGFYDPDGTGNGGEAYGMIFSNGERLRGREGCSMKVISLSEDDKLNVSDKKPSDAREAVQFDPVLILDGDLLISGSSGWGLQPRTVIGQTKDGQMMLSVVDGRQVGYSIGITLGDLSDIFYQYGAYQACNLDGGSSSIMYYDGRSITRSSSADPEHGRHIPDAWLVYPAGQSPSADPNGE